MITKILALGMFLFIANVGAADLDGRVDWATLSERAEEEAAVEKKAAEKVRAELTLAMGAGRGRRRQAWRGAGHPDVRKEETLARLRYKVAK